MRKLTRQFKRLASIIKTNASAGREYAAGATAINTRRLFYVALVAAPLSFVYVLVFGFLIQTNGEMEELWRIGIFISHLVLFSLMAIVGGASRWLHKHGSYGSMARILQYLTVIFILTIGMMITVIDQLVTTNITPFLIACMALGLTLLMRPIISGAIYAVVAILFTIAMSLTQNDATIMMSNRVNGYTATGLGLVLSIIMWKAHVRQIRQQQHILQQQHELEQKNNLLDQLASIDSMTGLRNRRSLQEEVAQEMRRMKRTQQPACLIITDLDKFKDINDRYGHPAGDFILIQLAGVLQQGLRESDVLARWGGEEFAILAPDCDMDEGIEMAERLRSMIEEHGFHYNESEETIHLTASFGVARMSADIARGCQDPKCFDRAYRQADRALYCAKKNGRNRVEAAQESNEPANSILSGVR